MTITVSGTTITFNDATTQSTAGQPGTVTSVATGNGLQGGTITTSGTLSVACPSFNTVGSYVFGFYLRGSNLSAGATVAAGSGSSQVQVACIRSANQGLDVATMDYSNSLSGTWRNMSRAFDNDSYNLGMFCRVS